jgi:hypothetical protein
MIQKVKKFVRDHEDAVVVSVVATSVAALTVLSYYTGKNQGMADMHVKGADLHNDNPENGKPEILVLTHANGKISRLKYVDR